MADEQTGQDLDGHHGVDAVLGRGRLAPEAVRRIGLALLDALGAAHARGVVHRDLKPDNVFLAGPAGAVRLLDVGGAPATPAGGADPADGSALGAISYLAPEQLADASRVDGRADLWAVGVMLYELLAGALPYRATSLGEMMSALALSEPVPIQVHLPSADASVRAFFARALARDRAQRFASAQDMARALAKVAIETAAPRPQTMGGMPTTASGEIPAVPAPIPMPPIQSAAAPVATAPVWLAAPVSRPPAVDGPRVRLSASRPIPAPERRWLGVAIAAVAVVAIIVGIIAIITSVDATPAPWALPASEAAASSSR
jgi:serine/threonine protein kinase